MAERKVGVDREISDYRNTISKGLNHLLNFLCSIYRIVCFFFSLSPVRLLGNAAKLTTYQSNGFLIDSYLKMYNAKYMDSFKKPEIREQAKNVNRMLGDITEKWLRDRAKPN